MQTKKRKTSLKVKLDMLFNAPVEFNQNRILFSFFDPRTQESDTSCLEILAAVLMQLHIREIEAFQPGDNSFGRGEDILGSSCDKIP